MGGSKGNTDLYQGWDTTVDSCVWAVCVCLVLSWIPSLSQWPISASDVEQPQRSLAVNGTHSPFIWPKMRLPHAKLTNSRFKYTIEFGATPLRLNNSKKENKSLAVILTVKLKNRFTFLLSRLFSLFIIEQIIEV